jgi:PAS domain S-box-containing protein
MSSTLRDEHNWRHEPSEGTRRVPSSERVTARAVPPEIGRTTATPTVVLRSVRALPAWQRYGLAVLATAIALAASLLLRPYLERVVFVLFWPAVLVSAAFAGLGPALLASTLSMLAVNYWLMEPLGAFALRAGDLVPLGIFFLCSALVSGVADRRRAAEARAAAAARDNAELATQLEEQAIELESQLEQSEALTDELEQTTAHLEEQTEAAEDASRFARGILESIVDPFVVQDAQWRFRYINAAAARVFAASGHGDAESVVGRVVWDVYPQLIGSAYEREMRRAAEQRVPVEFEAFYAEGGTWSAISCYPLADGGLATQWRDITARKKAEEALHYLDRASQLLTGPLDTDPRLGALARLVVPDLADWCAIDLLDEAGQRRQVAVAHVDRAKVEWARELNRRYPPRPDAPTGVPNVLRTGRPELYAEITDDMLVAGAVDEEHLRITRELGLRSAMVVPLTAGGHTFGALTLVSAESRRRYTTDDLALATELARRAALAVDNARQHQTALERRREAEDANRAKSQFLAAMSHELRTPLNAIAGYVDLLLLGVRGPVSADQRADLERVQRAQRHLLGLIADILEFARVEAGRIEYHLASVSLTALLSDVQTFVQPQVSARNLALHSELPDADVNVNVDADKARQILLNLLSNALKFTPSGGRIAVRSEWHDRHVLVHVADTGIGIPADQREAIFAPFVQVRRALTDRTVGVGLGLTISRELARGMGGDLTVESNPGVGTTFTFEMPRAD